MQQGSDPVAGCSPQQRQPKAVQAQISGDSGRGVHGSSGATLQHAVLQVKVKTVQSRGVHCVALLPAVLLV